MSKIMCDGFAPYEVLYTTSLIKKSSYDFLSNKVLSRSRSLILIMSSKK